MNSGSPCQSGERSQQEMVEAAGIEPVLNVNTNPVMSHDFGFYDMKTFELPRRFESPGVLPSLGDIMETAEASPKPLI